MKKNKNKNFTKVIRLYFKSCENSYDFWDKNNNYYVFSMVSHPMISDHFFKSLFEVLELVKLNGKDYIDVKIEGNGWKYNINNKRIIECKDPTTNSHKTKSFKMVEIL